MTPRADKELEDLGCLLLLGLGASLAQHLEVDLGCQLGAQCTQRPLTVSRPIRPRVRPEKMPPRMTRTMVAPMKSGNDGWSGSMCTCLVLLPVVGVSDSRRR